MSATQHQTLEAIRYQRGSLEIIDQLILPHQTVYIPIATLEAGHDAIKTMKVRGAPAIAIVAALSLAVVISHQDKSHDSTAPGSVAVEFVQQSLEYLKTSRPTAVNLFDAAKKLLKGVQDKAAEQGATSGDVKEKYLQLAEQMLEDDVKDNQNIGHFGAEFILRQWKGGNDLRVLTHCNTGSLATAGYGTALGIIRSLAGQQKLTHAYCTETRPYNQGSRLTAYELVYEKIPSTLVTDSMVAALLTQNKGKIAAIVVGADRVAANGDTANKIGTYQLAILAQFHGVPFIVAAPATSVDLTTATGADIHIEVRPSVEVTSLRGPVVESIDHSTGQVVLRQESNGSLHSETIAVAAKGIQVWNPSFDVTPAELISAIVTEQGVVLKTEGSTEFDMARFLAK